MSDPAPVSKIRHTQTALGQPIGAPAAPAVTNPPTEAASSRPAGDASAGASVPPAEPPKKEIRAFGNVTRRHSEEWDRTPNATGHGAIHVRTFHSKLSEDALSYMDGQINEWLDSHPEYEVKFVSACIGPFVGKIREDQLIVQVWV